MRDKIQTKIAAALSGRLSQAAQALTLRRSVRTADKVRGTFEESVTDYAGRGVCRLSWSAQEMSALGIPQTDGKALILQNELAVMPKEGDKLDFGDGWCGIIRVTQDPAGVAWVVQYRKA